MRPREFCHAIHMNNIIIEALRLSLYASRIEYSSQLTFSLRSIPEVFQPSGKSWIRDANLMLGFKEVSECRVLDRSYAVESL